jgi:membrane protease YdiL (CAAX protease family)
MENVLSGSARERARDVLPYFVLACALTWLADAPWVFACMRGREPPAYALPLLGLGAFGPTAAAALLAWRHKQLGEVFGRWRAPLAWIALALALTTLLHLPATLIEVALGGEPARWFYPPLEPERIAGLVFFSVGEEFGWRGFAYPRLADRFGAVRGSLLLGVMWAVWHLGMMFSPNGAPTLDGLTVLMLELALASVIWAWFMEHGQRSMAVAIALHAGAHLDNVSRAPESELRLRMLRLLVLALVAAIAARALRPRAQGAAAL